MRDRGFELIFREHNRMITCYLYSIVGNWGDAVELAQETFVTAYSKMDDFDTNRSLAAWLRGIALNMARNYLRKKNRSRLFLSEGQEIDGVFSVLDNIKTGELWEERLSALSDCRGKLPENQKKVVDLFYDSGKSSRAIALEMGLVEKTVFQFLWLARKSLKLCIESLVGRTA